MATHMTSNVTRRLLTILFWGGLIVVLTGSVVWAEAHRPAEWRQRLAGVVPVAQVVVSERAQAPWLFRDNLVEGELDLGSFGSHPQATPVGSARYGIAMPQTPETVYCVLADDGDAQRLIYVNYYNDQLYQADWVALAGATAPFSAATAQAVAHIGCATVAARLGN